MIKDNWLKLKYADTSTKKLYLLMISLFLGGILLNYFYNLFSNSIESVSEICISYASKEGVSINKKTNLYWNLVVLGFVLFPTFFILIDKLLYRIHISENKLSVLAITATMWIFGTFGNIMNIKSDNIVELSIFLFVFYILFVLLKKIKFFKIYAEPSAFLPVLIFTTLIFTSIVFILNSNPFIQANGAVIFMSIFAIMLLCIYCVYIFLKLRLNEIFHFFIPISTVPILLFIAIELQFFSKNNYDTFIAYKWFFLLAVAACVIVYFIARYFAKRKNKKCLFNKNLFQYLFIPAALLCVSIFNLYNPFVQNSTDLFELANPANSQMRMFLWGEIPFVDYLSSHALSEQFYGFLYNIIHGYSGDLAFLSYEFINPLLIYFLAFFLLKNIFNNPVLAFLFVISFPFFEVLFPKTTYALLAFFVVIWALKKQSISRYLVLFTVMFFSMLWSFDIAFAICITLPVFYALCVILDKISIKWKPLLISIGITISVIGIAFYLFGLLRGFDYLTNNFFDTLDYLSANQSHGLPKISHEQDHNFFLIYFFLPLSAVLACLYLIFKIRKKAITNISSYEEKASLLLFFIYLANVPRGIVRHSFIENTDGFAISIYFLAITIFLCSLIAQKGVVKYISLIVFSFFLMITIKVFPFDKSQTILNSFFKDQSIKNIDFSFNENDYKGRVIIDDNFAQINYLDIKNYMDSNFTKEQTFFDFSNTPMLYYYCQRQVPSYYCQGLQNIVTDNSQLRTLQRFTENKIPVIIYSNHPINWFDQTDGVPNSMRQYILAEYFYENYRPIGVLNNHSIWLHNKLNNIPKEIKPDEISNTIQIYDYKLSAKYIDDFLSKNLEKFQLKEEVIATNIQDSSIFAIPESCKNRRGLFLKVNFDNITLGQNISLYIQDSVSTIGEISFQTTENKSYSMPISNFYLWYKKTPTKIISPKNEMLSISKISFFQDTRINTKQ